MLTSTINHNNYNASATSNVSLQIKLLCVNFSITSVTLLCKHLQSFRPKLPHPHEVHDRVSQRVESHCHYKHEQPDISLQEGTAACATTQEVLPGDVHCCNIPSVVYNSRDVEENVNEGDEDYGYCRLFLYLGGGGGCFGGFIGEGDC